MVHLLRQFNRER